MKKRTRVCFLAGVCLLALAVFAVAWSQIAVRKRAETADRLAETLCSMMPQTRMSFPDGRSNSTLPMIELDGTDFAGVLEAPAYGVRLPVCGTWNAREVAKYPHRFAGSPYDGSLVIGGSDNSGQMAFAEQISVGDCVYFTDMTGACFRYTVERVEKTDDVTASHLCDGAFDLTLFARNTYGLEYTVLRCVCQ